MHPNTNLGGLSFLPYSLTQSSSFLAVPGRLAALKAISSTESKSGGRPNNTSMPFLGVDEKKGFIIRIRALLCSLSSFLSLDSVTACAHTMLPYVSLGLIIAGKLNWLSLV